MRHILPSNHRSNKILIVPISTQEWWAPTVRRLSNKPRALGISSRVGYSATSIGRRYARNDELGTPSGFTIDFQSLKDSAFTLRDRDTMKQVRASEEEICKAIRNLTEGTETWQDVAMRLSASKRQKVDKINPASELCIIHVPCG